MVVTGRLADDEEPRYTMAEALKLHAEDTCARRGCEPMLTWPVKNAKGYLVVSQYNCWRCSKVFVPKP